MKDLEKRKRVMQRSMRLGHCICDAKKPCPCDIFKEKDVCLCAGERLEETSGPVLLTRLVENAGCASKIDQATLKAILQDLPSTTDPRVLIGVPAGDDAGVYQLDGNLALVQTVDVFCPSVDDPYVFGQIAAANSLSDVYAMGGQPITALSIVGFPVRSVPDKVMADILRGGLDKMAEAGVAVIGGHSIKDPEIKAGFAVTGLIDKDKILTNAGARPGDVLVLTKPIGTGILAFAAQIERAPDEALAAIAEAMSALNKTASEIMMKYGAHASTDVTGFGLMGHLSEMARSSKVDVEIVWDDIPVFPGVLECVAEGIIPGGVERNRESSGERVEAGPRVTGVMLDICFDAQTSGGLLIAAEAASAKKLLDELHRSGIDEAAIIGKVTGKGSGRIMVTTNGRRTIRIVEERTVTRKESRMTDKTQEPCCATPPEEAPSCCAVPNAAGATPGHATGITSEIRAKFTDFLKTNATPGALDGRTKTAIAIVLSVLSKCGPCTKHHAQKARQLGMSQDDIDEAAWMAIAFGGSPVMMFYEETKKS